MEVSPPAPLSSSLCNAVLCWTVKSRFLKWHPSAHFDSINWDFTLNRDFLMWNSISVARFCVLNWDFTLNQDWLNQDFTEHWFDWQVEFDVGWCRWIEPQRCGLRPFGVRANLHQTHRDLLLIKVSQGQSEHEGDLGLVARPHGRWDSECQTFSVDNGFIAEEDSLGHVHRGLHLCGNIGSEVSQW